MKRIWRRFIGYIGAGGRIFVFIVLSLLLWVIISWAVNAAYECLPRGTRGCLATASGIWAVPSLPLTMPGKRAWFFLVLPVAMLIAGLWVWPSDDEPGALPGKPRADPRE